VRLLARASGDNSNATSIREASCVPGEAPSGTCMAQIVLPSDWWPPLAGGLTREVSANEILSDVSSLPPPKHPKVAVSVSYEAYESVRGHCDSSATEQDNIAKSAGKSSLHRVL